MRVLVAVSDEAGKKLDDFKRRHADCENLVGGLDKPVGNCFEYAYVPSTLGGIVEVKCACGTRWLCDWDEHIRELPAHSAKYVDFDEVDIRLIKTLLFLGRRTKLVVPPGGGLMSGVLAYKNGMTMCRFIEDGTPRDCAYDKVMERHAKRLMQRFDLKAPDFDDYRCKRFVEKAGGDVEAVAIWNEELRNCIKEEFPEIAERIGLVR